MKKIFLSVVAIVMMSGVAVYADKGKKPHSKKVVKTEDCKKANCPNTTKCHKESCPNKPGCICN